MKTRFFAFVAIAALFAAACTSESLGDSAEGGEVTVNFVVETPNSISTKAFSDGTTAAKNELRYVVYAAGEDTPLIDKPAPFEGLKATVPMTLVRNKVYDIIFWAQSADAPYTFDPATQSVTVNYKGADGNGIPANYENLDAFYFTVKGYVGGETPSKVFLTRPFAQINVGANDVDAAKEAGYTAGTSSMTVENVASKINLYTDEVSGYETVNFTPSILPVGEEFPVEGYEYIEMNYLLVSKTATRVKFTVSSDNENDIEFDMGGIPLQRNYRTNLYGSILTENVEWIVEINAIYDNKEEDTEFNKPIQ